MGKAVLISIKPQWCELIASGKKTLEVRKTSPNLETPFKCYIYQTKAKWAFAFLRKIGFDEAANVLSHSFGKVIGEFVCDECSALCKHHLHYIEQYGMLPKDALLEYLGVSESQDLTYDCMGCYGWDISDLVIYDRPKDLCEFMRPCKCIGEYEGETYCDCLNCDDAGDSDYGVIACDRKLKRPPQSWCYVEELGAHDE